MTAGPQVSIIVPAYNAEAVLRPTLESIRSQTWQGWEAIIVDDGSSDRTGEIAAEFVRLDSRFRLIRQKNTGVAGARNHALSHAVGEWIAFLDADDVWLPRKLEQQWALIMGDPACDFIFSNYLIWNGVEDIGRRYASAKKVPRKKILPRLISFNLFGISSVLVKKSLLNRVGRFDQSVAPGEDWDMWLRMAEVGFSPRGIFQPLLRYRVWPGNASGNPLEMAHVNVRVLEKGWGRNRNTELASTYERALNMARGKVELASVRALLETDRQAVSIAVDKARTYSPFTVKWLLWSLALRCPHWLGGEALASLVYKRIAAKW